MFATAVPLSKHGPRVILGFRTGHEASNGNPRTGVITK
jgi:hypothetical protein